MKVKVKFLIHTVRQHYSVSWVARCPAVSIISDACRSRKQAVEEVQSRLEHYLQSEGRRFVSIRKATDETVTCPEGYIELPVDIWRCKLNGETCPLQAQVLITRKDTFISGCHAPKDKKEAIFRIIRNGKYNGSHHLPGRYLCPLCKGGVRTRYHYPWELTMLQSVLHDSGTEERLRLRKRLIEKGIDLRAQYCALCPMCLREVVSTIVPQLQKQLGVLELQFSL